MKKIVSISFFALVACIGFAQVSPTKASSWELTGNIVSANKSMGTKSAYDVVFITNNTERMRMSGSNSTVSFAAGIKMTSIAGYPVLAMDESTPSISNFTILKQSGSTIINGTNATPVQFRYNNSNLITVSNPGTNTPLIDLQSVLSNNALKFYNNYSIGLAPSKLLLNTDSGGSVQVSAYNGTTVTPLFTISGAGILEYADNAAALAAGLTATNVYRTGDQLKVVH